MPCDRVKIGGFAAMRKRVVPCSARHSGRKTEENNSVCARLKRVPSAKAKLIAERRKIRVNERKNRTVGARQRWTKRKAREVKLQKGRKTAVPKIQDSR